MHGGGGVREGGGWRGGTHNGMVHNINCKHKECPGDELLFADSLEQLDTTERVVLISVHCTSTLV